MSDNMDQPFDDFENVTTSTHIETGRDFSYSPPMFSAPDAPKFSTSDSIAELAAALAAAQGEIANPKKNMENSHFRNRYADLSAVLDVVRPAFSKQGLALAQFVAGKTLVTLVTHGSGQWLRADTDIVQDKDGIQALGSVLTYLRRYTAQAVAGIAADADDDAEGAVNRSAPAATRRKVKRP